MAIRLPKLKQEFEWLGDADSQALQQSLQNLSRAFENFFAKRGKYPRFKSKHGRQSIQYPQRVKIEGSRIYLPKVGWVKCVVHREIIGKFKTVTVSRNACGQFHAAILTDNGEAMPAVSTDGKAIGIDVGLTHLAVTSDGSKFENPRHLRKAEKNLKRKQRKLSRKKKGSNGRNKARQLVARAHERVAWPGSDNLHKLSRRIVNENQVIVVEDLHVKGIMANHSLAKALLTRAGACSRDSSNTRPHAPVRRSSRCDRWYPSSKACSECGSICDKMPLDVRAWTCAHCGAHHDRDINAAKNIRAEGLRILAGGAPAAASGGNVSPGKRRNLRVGRLPVKLEARSFRAE